MGRRDAYQEITDQVIAALEAGTVPWQRPWRDFGMQRNLTSDRPYRGVNQLLTQIKQQLRGYETPYWLTFRAARKAGGHVRRGEKATMVVLWKRILVEDEDTEEKQLRWWMRPYTVFNLDQVEGVDAPTEDEVLEFEPVERAEAIVAAMPDPPAIVHRPGDAAYTPALDQVELPPRESFVDEPAYYGTAFHELVHSTGAEHRLDRGFDGPTTLETYSREELIAELGNAMLCAEAEIAPRIEQHAAYLANWLEALRGDKRMIAVASGRAQRAVDYILGTEFDDDQDPTTATSSAAASE